MRSRRITLMAEPRSQDAGCPAECARSRRHVWRPGRPDSWLAPRRTDVLRPVTPAAQRPCRRFGPAGERAHSPRRAWLSLHRAVSDCGDPVSRENRVSRPVQAVLPASRLRPVRRRRGQAAARAGPAPAAAGRLRSGPAGTSASAISLAEHRVEFGVGPDLPDLLRAAAGDGDPGSPPQRLLA